MPANLDRALQHIIRACLHVDKISARTLQMVLACAARLSTLLQVEEIRQRAYLAAALS